MSLAEWVWGGAAWMATPGLRVMLRRRVRRGKEIAARLGEREGIDETARPGGRLVWVHAASLGESVLVLPVVERVVARGVAVLMTTGTVSSAVFLGERLPGLREGRVLHRFVPLDVPGWVGRFLDHWRPDVAAFVESELWPNLLAGCGARGVPLMLVNGRMSARSARGWGRFRGFAGALLGRFDVVHARSGEDAARLEALGARAAALVGDLKRAAEPLGVDEGALERWRGEIGGRPVWLAASTHPGEERAAGAVHAALVGRFPELLTIVAPRHPERGEVVAGELGAGRLGAGEGPAGCGIWVVDGVGQLGLLYRLAPVVFVGRSLVTEGGGQNPLEAARLGCAVAVGPYTGNFVEAVAGLRAAGGLAVVEGVEGLAEWVGGMLGDEERREAMGRAGMAAASGEADLPERVAARLLALMEGS